MSVLRGKSTNRDGKDILNVLYETWRDENKGQKIIGCWIGGFVVASIWGIYIKRRLKISERSHNKPITRKFPSSFLLKNLENSELCEEVKISSINDRSISIISEESGINDTPQDIDDDDAQDSISSFSTFKGVLDIAIPSIFTSPILWSTLLSTSLIWKSSNISTINDSIGYMGELLVSKKWKLLSHSTMDFAVKTVYASLAVATVNFLSRLLSLSLRDNLTMCISSKFRFSTTNNNNIAHLYHCKQEIDNIDSRICVDINEWSKTYSLCFVSFCKPIIDVTIYSNKLIQRIGIFYFAQCIFYFFISSMWTRSILPSYNTMKENLLKYEAKFQNNNKRIIEFCEEIHYLRGISTEIKILDDSYCLLYNKLSSISIYDYIYEFCHNYIVRYLGILASFISLLPMIKNEKMPTQFLLNNLHDLVNIGLAFRDLMRSSKEFQSLKGISNRIIKLNNKLTKKMIFIEKNQYIKDSFYDEEDLDDLEDDDDDEHHNYNYNPIPINIKNANNIKNIDIYKDDDDDIAYIPKYNQKQIIIFKNVTIETPDRSKLLLKKLNFTINLGENVLICGPNGAGKSSLIRVICGLWKCQNGKIKMRTKQMTDIYFLPSRSYLIPNLSIKQQILYPDIYNEDNHSDDIIIELLNECGLGKLVDFIHDVNDNITISDQFWLNLSDGEKQLISLCRVLIKKPKLVFIDESFSNLSMDKIQWFYKKLSILNITAVTITHNLNETKLHHHIVLNLIGDGSGKYTIQKI